MTALDDVVAWDLSDESIGAAPSAQVNLLAGGDPEQLDAFRPF